MIVGCYTLDLYCDNATERDKVHGAGEYRYQYTGHTERECLQQARKDGWAFVGKHRDERKAYCPRCRPAVRHALPAKGDV